MTHRGIQDFSLRVLSEGRYQDTTWTRNVSEAVFANALFKKLRDSGVDIDTVAASFFESSPPDKHKESQKFISPLIDNIVD